MTNLRTALIRLAASMPAGSDNRKQLLDVLKSAAKAPAKLKGKALEKEVNRCYYKFFDGVQVDIFDLSKIAKLIESAYLGADDPESATLAAEEAAKQAVPKFRKN